MKRYAVICSGVLFFAFGIYSCFIESANLLLKGFQYYDVLWVAFFYALAYLGWRIVRYGLRLPKATPTSAPQRGD